MLANDLLPMRWVRSVMGNGDMVGDSSFVGFISFDVVLWVLEMIVHGCIIIISDSFDVHLPLIVESCQ